MNYPYNKAWEDFLEKCGESEPDIEVEFSSGWAACKEEVLKILQQDLQNCDLSTDSCDNRYIEKVKEL